MKKILFTSILGLMATFGANAESSQGINACLYKLMNSHDVLMHLDSMALDFFDKYEYLRTMSPSEQLSVLLNHNKEQTSNFPAHMKQILAAGLVRECGQYIVPAINNESLPVSLCFAAHEGEFIKFVPSNECVVRGKEDALLYIATIKLENLFDYIPGTFAYVVTNTNAHPGQKISPDWSYSTPWTGSCSAEHPALNIPDDAAANTAGQYAFSSLLKEDADYEFFFDVPGGDVLAFPGMLLADEDFSDYEHIVVATNLKDALRRGDAFAKQVAGSGACRNLKMHLVSLPEIVRSMTPADGGTPFKAGAAMVATSGLLGVMETAVGASVIPGIGWVAAGVLAVGGGIIAFTVDADILDESERHPATVLKTWDFGLPMVSSGIPLTATGSNSGLAI